MERDSDTAATEFKVAIAGPIVTALIFVACLLAGWRSPVPTSSGTRR